MNRKKDIMDTMFQSVRGFRDIWGEEYARFDAIRSIAEKIAQAYGYQGIEMPLLEMTEVFCRTLGDTSDIVYKEMYTFADRNEGSLTLRPEGTAGTVRALIENAWTQDLPKRLYYCGPMFRHERPQKGRYRQFYQFGLECLGIAHPYADAEAILAAWRIIQALDVENPTLYMNSLGDAASRAAYRETLLNYFAPFAHELSEASQARLARQPLRVLDSKEPQDKKIAAGAPKLQDSLNDESKAFFESVCELLTRHNIPFELDHTMVRGLDYYAHTTFEVKSSALGAQDTFLAGGRYDGLVEIMGGPSIPGIGWAMGMDRMALLMRKAIESNPLVLVIPFDENVIPYALEVAERLRSNDAIHVEMSYKGKLNKDMKYAEKRGATYAVLLGSNEMETQTVTLKYLKGEQRPNATMPLDEVAKELAQ